MLRFDPELEKFKNSTHFTKDDPCVWVVYPGGAAGDLLSSIINYHYVNTGAFFKGVDANGRAIFQSTDDKLVNFILQDNYDQLIINEKFFLDINRTLSEKNTNYSCLDQFIFSNHAFRANNISIILDNFPKCKIIRILPKTLFEKKIIKWLGEYKNKEVILPISESADTNISLDGIVDDRLLNVYFGDLLNSQRFENMYEQIVKHLNLNGKLVRFEFIEYWLAQQHEYIVPFLVTLRDQ
jgi:hypothetical protein